MKSVIILFLQISMKTNLWKKILDFVVTLK